MVGTLIKTMPNGDRLFVGLIYDWYYEKDEHDETIHVHVKWNDCDDTTEIFHEYEDYDVSEYYFYHKGRWWLIYENFWKFKEVLEGKCK